MGLFTFSSRVYDLMHQKSNIEYKMLQLTRKIQNLQEYSTFVGAEPSEQDQYFSGSNMLSLPASEYQRAMFYRQRAYAATTDYVNRNSAMAQQMFAQSQGGNITQQQAAYVQKQLYLQGMDRARQYEEKCLKVEEDKLKNDKERLQTLLSEVTQELEEARKARDNSVKELAPKYVAGQ
jgi:hypothetical protein